MKALPKSTHGRKGLYYRKSEDDYIIECIIKSPDNLNLAFYNANKKLKRGLENLRTRWYSKLKWDREDVFNLISKEKRLENTKNKSISSSKYPNGNSKYGVGRKTQTKTGYKFKRLDLGHSIIEIENGQLSMNGYLIKGTFTIELIKDK